MEHDKTSMARTLSSPTLASVPIFATSRPVCGCWAAWGCPCRSGVPAAGSDRPDWISGVEAHSSSSAQARSLLEWPRAPVCWQRYRHWEVSALSCLARSAILCCKQDLHAAHQALTRTMRRARQTVFWPHLTYDLDNLIRSCPQCRLHTASQPKEPLQVEVRAPTLPFQRASADLFSCQGRQHLVYADRLTGWPCLSDLGRSADSASIIIFLCRLFADLGVPETLTTDNCPQ